MIELTKEQQREEFDSRLKSFQDDFKLLQDNYKLELFASVHLSTRGIIPVLQIMDRKYEAKGSKDSPLIIPIEQDEK